MITLRSEAIAIRSDYEHGDDRRHFAVSAAAVAVAGLTDSRQAGRAAVAPHPPPCSVGPYTPRIATTAVLRSALCVDYRLIR